MVIKPKGAIWKVPHQAIIANPPAYVHTMDQYLTYLLAIYGAHMLCQSHRDFQWFVDVQSPAYLNISSIRVLRTQDINIVSFDFSIKVTFTDNVLLDDVTKLLMKNGIPNTALK